MNKEEDKIKVTPSNYNINTLDLLHSHCDLVHLIYHNVFRLLKPVRRKYKLSVNSLIIINGFYVFHKYQGSAVTLSQLYKIVGYYNRERIKYYVSYLIEKGIIMKAEQIKIIQYYKLSELGIKIMQDFTDSYQEVLYKWLQDQKISL